MISEAKSSNIDEAITFAMSIISICFCVIPYLGLPFAIGTFLITKEYNKTFGFIHLARRFSFFSIILNSVTFVILIFAILIFGLGGLI